MGRWAHIKPTKTKLLCFPFAKEEDDQLFVLELPATLQSLHREFNLEIFLIQASQFFYTQRYPQ